MKTAILLITLSLLRPTEVFSQAAAPTVMQLHRQILETVNDGDKRVLLAQLAATPPVTVGDAQALYDLFARFTVPTVRNAVMASLRRLNPRNAQLAPVFHYYLEQDEPEDRIFGINGALILRSPKSLPLIEKIAKGKFKGKSAGDLALLSEKNAWWTQYEALSALAQWEGPEAYALLKRQAESAPPVAKIMGEFLWEKSLPQIADWTKSGGASGKEKAKHALSAAPTLAALTQTRGAMLKILRDSSADLELRHQLALKIGVSSMEDDVDALLKEREQSKDAQTRLLLSAAVFASRSLKAVPLLTQFAQENPDPRSRAGALFQLKEMLSVEQYRPLLEWAVKNETDPENKEEAQRQLKLLGQKK